MNRTTKQYLAKIIMTCMMTVLLPIQTMTAYGASGRIAFSDKTASVGSEISINMKITLSGGGALNNATVMLSYDASMLEFLSGTGASGGAGAIRISIGGDTADAKELVSTLKFKALQAGTTKISVNTEEVYGSDNQAVTIDQKGSSVITLKALANASKEASLSDLKVSPGTLSPEFSKDVFSYSADVDADVTKITVSAPAADSKASVVISGSEDLQPGENQVICKVIAEDGSTVKEYTIAVTRAGGDGSTAAASIAVETPAKTVTIIPLDEDVKIPEGFTECTIKIDGRDAQGWVWASDTDYKYCIFYGMNENGDKDFYRYDLTEKTMQRYFRDPASETHVSADKFTALATEHNSLLADYELRMYVIIGLAAVAVILLILVIVLAVKRKHGGDDDDYTNYDEKLNERRVPVKSGTREDRHQRGIDLLEGEPVRRSRGAVRRAEPDLDDRMEDRFGQASPAQKSNVPAPSIQKNPSRSMQVKPAAGARSGTDATDEEEDAFEFVDLDE